MKTTYSTIENSDEELLRTCFSLCETEDKAIQFSANKV